MRSNGQRRPSPAQTTDPCVVVRRDGNISGAHFVALAGHLGVRARAARAIIGRVADSADTWIGELDALPFDGGILHKLARVIRHRQELLRQA